MTLVELLAALAVAGLILACVAVVIADTVGAYQRLRQCTVQDRYLRMVDLMAADCRGLARIEPLDRSGVLGGQAVATFVTTNALAAIQQGRWNGSVRVNYVVRTTSDGLALWRIEQGLGGQAVRPCETCLVDGLDDVRLDLMGVHREVPWPAEAQAAQALVVVQALRCRAALRDGSKRQELEVVELPLMVQPGKEAADETIKAT